MKEKRRTIKPKQSLGINQNENSIPYERVKTNKIDDVNISNRLYNHLKEITTRI
jgi:hypothetical protein